MRVHLCRKQPSDMVDDDMRRHGDVLIGAGWCTYEVGVGVRMEEMANMVNTNSGGQ